MGLYEFGVGVLRWRLRYATIELVERMEELAIRCGLLDSLPHADTILRQQVP